jgi:hypothetical protein
MWKYFGEKKKMINFVKVMKLKNSLKKKIWKSRKKKKRRKRIS